MILGVLLGLTLALVVSVSDDISMIHVCEVMIVHEVDHVIPIMLYWSLFLGAKHRVDIGTLVLLRLLKFLLGTCFFSRVPCPSAYCNSRGIPTIVFS